MIMELAKIPRQRDRASEENKEDGMEDSLVENKNGYYFMDGGIGKRVDSSRGYSFPEQLDPRNHVKQTQVAGGGPYIEFDKLVGGQGGREIVELFDKNGGGTREGRPMKNSIYQFQPQKYLMDAREGGSDEGGNSSLGKRAPFESQSLLIDPSLPVKRNGSDFNSDLANSPNHLQLVDSRLGSPSNSVTGFKLHSSRKNSELDDMGHTMKLGRQKSFEELSSSGI